MSMLRVAIVGDVSSISIKWSQTTVKQQINKSLLLREGCMFGAQPVNLPTLSNIQVKWQISWIIQKAFLGIMNIVYNNIYRLTAM